MKLIALSIAALLAPPAPAENWVVMSVTGDGSAAVLVDTDATISAPGGVRKIRQLIVFRAPVQSTDAILSESQINCGAKTIRIGRSSIYDVKGTLLSEQEDHPDIPWSPIYPGSNYAAVRRLICGKFKMPSSRFGAGLPIAEVRQMLIEEWP